MKNQFQFWRLFFFSRKVTLEHGDWRHLDRDFSHWCSFLFREEIRENIFDSYILNILIS